MMVPEQMAHESAYMTDSKLVSIMELLPWP